MPDLPRFSGQEAIRVFQRLGSSVVRPRGSEPFEGRPVHNEQGRGKSLPDFLA